MGEKAGLAAIEDGFIASGQIACTVDSTTVHTGSGKLRGVYVNESFSIHTVVIKDGAAAKFTIPVSTPAGMFIPLGDAEFLTSLVVDPDDAMTAGNVTLVYNPYPET